MQNAKEKKLNGLIDKIKNTIIVDFYIIIIRDISENFLLFNDMSQ